MHYVSRNLHNLEKSSAAEVLGKMLCVLIVWGGDASAFGRTDFQAVSVGETRQSHAAFTQS